MKWSFPSNNNTDTIGISNSGVETFQGTPLKSLAREICQNSLDAAVQGKVVEVEFKSFDIEIDDFPDADSLNDAFRASFEFWSIQSNKKAQDIFERSIKTMEIGTIPFLRISDFNTTGLTGSKGEYNTPWCNLTKSSGVSDKAGTSGGSFGIGKFAPFACSDLRTVFYNTLDIEGEVAFQGISRITSFRRKEDNEITMGVGYYGSDNNKPVFNQLSLDPSFSRASNVTGTDIYIAGFKYHSTNWKEDIITSIIDGFLHAILKGSLIARVDDVEISANTLPILIDEYKDSFAENADKYYKVFTSPDTVWYKDDFKTFGNITLGLIIHPDMHRKVAMIRKTGMKIMDRGNISTIVPFAGVMLIEGDKINDFLRSLENPQHTKWEPERSVNQGMARIFIRDLINFIKEQLEKLKEEDESDEIDPSVGEYLPAENEIEETAESKKSEAIVDDVKEIEIKSLPRRKIPSNSISIGDEDEIIDEDGDIVEDIPSDGSGHGNGKIHVGGPGYGDKPGSGDGSNTKEQRKSLVGVDAVKIRIICLNKSKGEYSITFVPSISAENGRIDLMLSAETQSYEADILSASIIGQPPLLISKNHISGLKFKANTPLRIKVAIDFFDYCSMEVMAYGNKI